ncbi:hypothetical protein AB0P07_00090 [Streptomyces sp. NPDC085944]
MIERLPSDEQLAALKAVLAPRAVDEAKAAHRRRQWPEPTVPDWPGTT